MFLTSRKARSPKPARRRFAIRPYFERLEDRHLLGAVSWIGGDGDWNVAANWSTGEVPGAEDDVTIGDVVGDVDVTLAHSSGGIYTINSLKLADSSKLVLTAGSMTVAGNTQVAGTCTVELQKGSLGFLGGGTGTGSFHVAAGAQLTLAGMSLNSDPSAPSVVCSVTGDGAVGVHGCTMVGGVYDIEGSTIVGGTVFSGTVNSEGLPLEVGRSLCIGSGVTDFGGGLGAIELDSLRVVGSANLYDTTITTASYRHEIGDLACGDLTVTQQMVWIAGTLEGSGTTTIEGNQDGQEDPTDAVATLSTPWSGLQSRHLEGGRKLVNNGVVKVDDPLAVSTLYLRDGAMIVNKGLFHVTNGRTNYVLTDDGSSTEFENQGTYVQASPGAGTVFTNVVFDNSGTVKIESGGTHLNGGGTTSGGTFQVEAGAKLGLGEHTLDSNSSVTGMGVAQLYYCSMVGGIYEIGGGTVVGGTVFSGTVNSEGGPLEVGNLLSVANGQSDFGGGLGEIELDYLTVKGSANLHDTTIFVATYTHELGDLTCGDLTVTGQMEWTAGTMGGSGTTTIEGNQDGQEDPTDAVATLSTPWSGLQSRHLEGGRTLLNNGIVNVDDPSAVSTLYLRDGAQIINQGLFRVTSARTGYVLTDDGSSTKFDNQGTYLQASPGAATVFTDVVFDNSGTVKTESGEAHLTGGGTTSSGKFQVAAGAKLLLGQHTLDSNSSVTGMGAAHLYGSTLAGTYAITGGTLVSGSSFTGAVTSIGDFLTVTGGMTDFGGRLGGEEGIVLKSLVVTGSANLYDTTITTDSYYHKFGDLTCGDLTVTEQMTWKQGTIAGTGASTNIAGGATLDFADLLGFGERTLDGRTLNNAGTATWTGERGILYLKDGAQFNNLAGGLFRAHNEAYYAANFQSIGSLSTEFNNQGTFVNSLTDHPFVFVGVPFNNSGTVDAQTGTTSFSGGYLQTGGDIILGGGDLRSLVTPLDIQAGTLSGSGTVWGSVFNGGQTSPGLSAGDLGAIQVGADYTQTGSFDVQLEVRIEGTERICDSDRLDIGRSVTLGGTLNVSSVGLAPEDGESFMIIKNDGLSPVVGHFDGLPEGATFMVGTTEFQITYTGGTGNDVVVTALAATVLVEIDVKPDSDANVVNLLSNGVIPVALLTTADFNGGTVDVSSIRFIGAEAVHHALEDVDADGDLDLILHFRIQDTLLDEAYVAALVEDLADGVLDSNHQDIEATLSGLTIDGTLFEGTDILDAFYAGKALQEVLLTL